MSKELVKAAKSLNKSELASEEIDLELEGDELEEAFMEAVESVSPKDEKKLPDNVVELYNELSTKPSPKKSPKKKSDDDDDDEDEKPAKKKKTAKDDDDDDDDDKPVKKGKKASKNDDDDDEDEPPKKKKKPAKDDDDDDEDEKPKKKSKKSDDDDDDEDEKPTKKGKKSKETPTIQQICMKIVLESPKASFEKMTKKAAEECEDGVDLTTVINDVMNQCLDYYEVLDGEGALAE